MRLISGMILGLTMITSMAFSKPAIDPAKAVIIDGVIAQGNVLPIGKELLARAEAGEPEVQMIINSPGGEVITGMLFVNMMEAAKAKGLKISCFVPTVAASMAYSILMHCSERYTLNGAFLLWHRARINVGGMFGKPMTSVDLLTLGKDLKALDGFIFNEVVKYMGMDMATKDLLYHFNVETLHLGLNLHKLAPHFITTYTAISGLFETLLNRDVPRNKVLDRSALSDADIIYITDKVN